MRVRALLILTVAGGATAFANGIPDQDRRNREIPHTDTHFTLTEHGTEYTDLAAWKKRAEFLRKQILSSAGLMPMPPRTPLHPQVFDKVEGEDYSIEKVLLETHPGFFLGGNLYRPKGREAPFPAVVSPHGHWRYGRLENSEAGSVPARGISLARQGFVVFTYDMIGYNDTMQLPHGFEGPREQLWGIGMLGLQTWNSIRATDFVASLSDVDPELIGATGASGGGTQTFMLQAIDERIKFSSPVNMISAIMQGGSVCENAPNLRIDTFNVEIGALMAPRPMMMISASGDWTRNTPVEEYPAIRSVYGLFDAASQLEQVQVDAPHNYNRQSREAVYAFFGKKVLHDADASHFKEQGFTVPQLSSLISLWGRELPAHAVDQAGLIRYYIGETEKNIASLRPRDSATLGKAQEAFRERLGFSIMASPPAADDVVTETVEELPSGEVFLVGRQGRGDRVPAVLLKSRRSRAGVLPTLIVHPEGSAWVLSSSESRDGLVQQLLTRGGTVMGIDAFQTGRAKVARDTSDKGTGHRYFTTFNRTDDANRIQDVLTAITHLRKRTGSDAINLVGIKGGGLWCVFARALADGPMTLVADLALFDAGSDAEFESHFFIPGLRKAGDFRGAATLLPSEQTILHNVAGSFPSDWVRDSFAAAAAESELQIQDAVLSDEEIAQWLVPTRSRRR